MEPPSAITALSATTSNGSGRGSSLLLSERTSLLEDQGGFTINMTNFADAGGVHEKPPYLHMLLPQETPKGYKAEKDMFMDNKNDNLNGLGTENYVASTGVSGPFRQLFESCCGKRKGKVSDACW
mmetsp:Transcript_22039/g.43329  ORF Transcript_22039/g.43329 Transcript_22039/m.43329 type:complete len:125 (+) Transcript_22039:131-505(+)